MPAPDHSPGTTSGAASRAVAARVLDAVLHHGRSLKAELAVALPRIADPRDRALVEAICFAVLRQPARLRGGAAGMGSASPLPERDSELKALLFVGFAQLDPLRIAGARGSRLRPSRRRARSAAATRPGWSTRCCAAPSAKACRRASRTRTGRRGCANSIARDWPQDDDRNPRCQRGRAADVVAREPPPAIARRLSRPSARGRHRGAGRRPLPDALRLDTPVAVAALPGFAEGTASVQDASAQLVADALAPAPGRACSTPAPRRAARPRICSNAMLRCAWSRSTSTRSDWIACARAWSRLRLGDACNCMRPTPPTRRRGGTACRSMPCCWMRRARRPASCGASPTCCCTAAPPT